MVDDATLVGLTQRGITKVDVLKQEVAEILPAGNLPAFLLQGLVQLKDRTLKPERVAADLRLLFQPAAADQWCAQRHDRARNVTAGADQHRCDRA